MAEKDVAALSSLVTKHEALWGDGAALALTAL